MKEFKVMVISQNKFKHVVDYDFSYVEKLLEEKSAEGWEVVSVCPDQVVGSLAAGLLFVTLQRDKQ